MAKAPEWILDTGPEEWVAVAAHCTLARNLADLPFPARCGEEDRLAAAHRVSLAVERNLSGAARVEFGGADALEAQWLGERRLVTRDWLHAPTAGRALFAPARGDLSIQTNGGDHVTLRAMEAGGGLSRAWERASAADDALGAQLNYAYDERLGHLTARLGMVGTGLRAGLLLHLPALALRDEIGTRAEALRAQRLILNGVASGDPADRLRDEEMPEPGLWSGAVIEPLSRQCLLTDIEGAVCRGSGRGSGGLYLLHNQETLGLTEEEIVFRTAHGARGVEEAELEARRALARDRSTLDDLVSRAAALARGARLLGFDEALSLLSVLRLGMSLGVLAGPGPARMNGALFEMQAGHLTRGRGGPAEARAVCARRAALVGSLVEG